MSSDSFSRRRFLCHASSRVAALVASRGLLSTVSAAAASKPSSTFIGLQLGPHSVFDEGPERCLDLLQATAGVNAAFVYPSTYQGFATERKLTHLAADHGVAPIDPQKRRLPFVWVKTHDSFYRDTFLRHVPPNPQEEFFGRDVFTELAEPARQRGIRLFARILEGYKPFLIDLVPGWSRILTRDIFGQPTHLPCLNHPAYRAWWLGYAEDLFTHYPLAGLKWGTERAGPLSELFVKPPWHTTAPGCFCEHCVAYAHLHHVDAERARLGFVELHGLIARLRTTKTPPGDGMLVGVLRTLIEYPEVLAWERLWHTTKEELVGSMRTAIRRIRPGAELGRHIWHQISFDPFYRAATDYARLVPQSDWLKPVVYHEAAHSRFQSWALAPLRQSFLADLPDAEAGQFLYRVLGYDPAQQPAATDHSTNSWDDDYVYRETKRCVDAVAGRIPVYPGIGFDIPGQTNPTEPERLKRTIARAFDAGAVGILLSREYDEMRVSSLRAAGEALRTRPAPARTRSPQ